MCARAPSTKGARNGAGAMAFFLVACERLIEDGQIQ